MSADTPARPPAEASSAGSDRSEDVAADAVRETAVGKAPNPKLTHYKYHHPYLESE